MFDFYLREWQRKLVTIVAQSAGGGVAIAIMVGYARAAGYPLIAIPFATSIVMVLGSPDVPAAQPRGLIGGHIVSTLVGFGVLKVFGPGPWQSALGVGLAMLGMHLTRTFHPPAGINPLVVDMEGMSFVYLINPVAIGACLLGVFAFVWHRLFRTGQWPLRWW